MSWKILPDKFMPVQIRKKDVDGWDDLERIRAQHAPVLGEEDWYETAKYNLTSFLFCDLMSKAFAWVFISTGLLLYLTYQDANHPTWEMGSLTTWFVWGNEVGSLLHFAAKDEFKKVIAAACSRWGGPAAPQTTTTSTQTAQVITSKTEKKEDTPP